MPILVKSPYASVDEGIRHAGSALSQALTQSIKERRAQGGLSAFQKGMEQGGDDPNSVARLYTQALNSGADPQQLGVIQQAYQQSQQKSLLSNSIGAANKAGGINTTKGKNAFLTQYAQGGGDPIEYMKLFKTDNKGQTVFDKKIDEFKAKAVIDHLQEGDQSQNVFKENLDYLEENIPNVGRTAAITGGGPLGPITGGEYGPMQSAKFAEYERRGNLVLDGVIKIYNKSGVLPQKKLEWIRKTFSISPFDTQQQIQGKISALRSLVKNTSNFEKGMGDLIQKYGNNIPNQAFMNVQSTFNQSLDKFDEQIQSPQPEQVHERLPTKGMKKGAIANDVNTGQKYVWTGTRWTKKR